MSKAFSKSTKICYSIVMQLSNSAILMVVPIAIKCLNVYQRFTVIDEVKGGMTTVLGRDFLQKFGTTEFCWNEGKVRLGKEWIYPKLWLKGGSQDERVAVMEEIEGEEVEHEFDINPELPRDQQVALKNLLMNFKDRFAPNPKKPSVTKIGEHRIDIVPDARPIKAKRFRMSPFQEEEVNKQAEEMIKNNVARSSSSPWG